MNRRKKLFFIGTALVLLLTAGMIGGIALAEDEAAPATPVMNRLGARIAAILGIEESALTDAFIQAREEMRTEAREQCLERMTENGLMNAEQAQEFRDWCEARPEWADKFGPQAEKRVRHGIFGQMRGRFGSFTE